MILSIQTQSGACGSENRINENNYSLDDFKNLKKNLLTKTLRYIPLIKNLRV